MHKQPHSHNEIPKRCNATLPASRVQSRVRGLSKYHNSKPKLQCQLRLLLCNFVHKDSHLQWVRISSYVGFELLLYRSTSHMLAG